MRPLMKESLDSLLCKDGTIRRHSRLHMLRWQWFTSSKDANNLLGSKSCILQYVHCWQQNSVSKTTLKQEEFGSRQVFYSTTSEQNKQKRTFFTRDGLTFGFLYNSGWSACFNDWLFWVWVVQVVVLVLMVILISKISIIGVSFDGRQIQHK